MTASPTDASSESVPTKTMEDLVSLCKRRGFIYPASEIYGGINGFWDYGPLGVALKNNLRDWWWESMVLLPPDGPDGEPLSIVGLDSSIIQNPKVWEASGHVGGFNDPRVDCLECKSRFRADHIDSIIEESKWINSLRSRYESHGLPDDATIDWLVRWARKEGQKLAPGLAYVQHVDEGIFDPAQFNFSRWTQSRTFETDLVVLASSALGDSDPQHAPCPNCGGQLTEPRAFNLMFSTVVGATGDVEDDKAYLRPETAQGIFVNYKNVLDTTRVRVPFGIAQVGKAFRNEVTPRNFIFRSREFEQMEMEWFCHPDDAPKWYEFWQQTRLAWWRMIGLTGDNLIMRAHDKDELSHYAKDGCGTCDVEYRYPFTAPGFGELEGIAHRSNFDLAAHEKHAKAKLSYFDQERNERYLPHVIEPAAGLSRGVLAVLCEAYTPDPDRPSKVYMKFHPRLAPIKAAVFALVKKDGMPEVADRLARELRGRFGRFGLIECDAKQSIGKRYARMDEAGTPFCFTIDGQTLEDQTVTMRDRDTAQQERMPMDRVGDFLGERLGLG